MKNKLRNKYLPNSHKQDVFLKLHEFRQGLLRVAEYIVEFENLSMKAEIHEPDEQTIARFLGGLRVDVRNMVQLQPYTSLLDVQKLSLRVEKILKESKQPRFGGKDVSKGTTPKIPFLPKSKVEDKDKDKAKKESEGSDKAKLAREKRCFKCHGFGHIASDCPNRRIGALMGEVGDESEDEGENEQLGSDEEGDEGELTYVDQGQAVVVQRSLKLTQPSQSEDWKRKNVFHTKCTCLGKVCLVIIDNGALRI